MNVDLARLSWRKSSYSGDNGGQCVEVAMRPRATHPHAVHVRDSKDPEGPALTFTSEAWASFVEFTRSV